jgi:hypothetical protein
MRDKNNKVSDKLVKQKITFMKDHTDYNINKLKIKERTSMFKEWQRLRNHIKNIRTKIKGNKR